MARLGVDSRSTTRWASMSLGLGHAALADKVNPLPRRLTHVAPLKGDAG